MRGCLLSVAAAGVMAAPSLGTVLTFDPHPGNGMAVNQTYGDRVTGPLHNGFAYGAEFGATPNIVATYGPVGGNVRHWDRGYGDLENVLYCSSGGVLDVRLQADPGSMAVLRSFSLAASGGVGGYYINAVTVLGPDGPLFHQSNVNIAGNESGTKRTVFEFSRVFADAMIIRFDASNLGSLAERIGIDDVAFGQIPAPGAALLLGAGLLGRRRR
jgi:hypothetical protein